MKVGRCAERDENTVSRSFSGEIPGPEGPTCGIVSRKEGISAPSDLSGKNLPGRKPRIRSTVSVFSVSAEYGGAAASAEASLFQKRRKRLFLLSPWFSPCRKHRLRENEKQKKSRCRGKAPALFSRARSAFLKRGHVSVFPASANQLPGKAEGPSRVCCPFPGQKNRMLICRTYIPDVWIEHSSHSKNTNKIPFPSAMRERDFSMKRRDSCRSCSGICGLPNKKTGYLRFVFCSFIFRILWQGSRGVCASFRRPRLPTAPLRAFSDRHGNCGRNPCQPGRCRPFFRGSGGGYPPHRLQRAPECLFLPSPEGWLPYFLLRFSWPFRWNGSVFHSREGPEMQSEKFRFFHPVKKPLHRNTSSQCLSSGMITEFFACLFIVPYFSFCCHRKSRCFRKKFRIFSLFPKCFFLPVSASFFQFLPYRV